MSGPSRRQAAASHVPFADTVRRHDPDRFLTALFAPAEHRDTLLLLYAFNHELARASEVASEPTIALIRLQWWREVVEGTAKKHELATRLAAALDAGRLARPDLLAMLDAREVETERAVPDLDGWRAYLGGTAGGVAVAAGRVLGAPDPEAFRLLGAAYGAAGVLRSAWVLARHGRCLLPEDALAAHGLTLESAIGAPDAPAFLSVLRDLAREGRAMLRAGRPAAGIGRRTIAAVLTAVLAGRDLGRIAAPTGPRGLGDRLAVAAAGFRGRLPSALGE